MYFVYFYKKKYLFLNKSMVKNIVLSKIIEVIQTTINIFSDKYLDLTLKASLSIRFSLLFCFILFYLK